MFRYFLRQSSDHSMFVPYPTNRNLRANQRLRESMIEHDFDPGYPLRCLRRDDGKLKITSGHHRFAIAIALGKPVWYVECTADISLFEAERTSIPWSLTNHVEAYDKAGLKDVSLLKKYAEETGMPMNCALELVRGRSAMSAHGLIDENYRAGDMVHANEVAQILKTFTSLGIGYSRQTNFVRALSQMLLAPNFNPRQLEKKSKAHTEQLKKCATIKEYLEMFANVVNFQCRDENKKPWAYIAAAASRARCVSSPESITRQKGGRKANPQADLV